MFSKPENETMECPKCSFIISTKIDTRRNRVVETKQSRQNITQGVKFDIGFI
jgi:hypothetical protein